MTVLRASVHSGREGGNVLSGGQYGGQTCQDIYMEGATAVFHLVGYVYEAGHQN